MAQPPVLRVGILRVLILGFLANSSTAELLSSHDCSPKAELPCTMYFMNGNDCSPPLLKTRFPAVYNDSNTFPNLPYNFTVTNFQQEWGNTNSYYPGVNVSIMPPVDASRSYLLGFEVTFIKVTSSSPSCLIFIFNFTGGLQWDDVRDGLNFVGEVYPVAGQTTYYFTAYSLPKPLPQYDRYLYQFITTGMYGWNNMVPSSEWYTSITYRNDSINGRIEFSFVQPPDDYKFVWFRILLLTGNYNGTQLLNTRDVQSKNISHFRDSFENVQTGWYEIKITPVDTHWQDYKKCLCKKSNGDCYGCLSTKTVPLLIKGESTTEATSTAGESTTAATSTAGESTTEATSTAGESTTEATSTAGESTTEATSTAGSTNKTTTVHVVSASNTKEVIAAAVLGSVLGVALVVVLLFFFLYYRRDKSGSHDDIPDSGKITSIEERVHNLENGCVNSTFVTTRGSAVPWSKKKIFLVNTEDHHKHLDVLKAFTIFLEKECRCQVTFAPNCIIADKLQWVINSIDESDFTVVVNSAAAFLQFDAWRNNKAGTHCQPLTRAGDIFAPAVQQIADRFMRNQDIGKVLSVQFDYTPDKSVIQDMCMGIQYKLMKHLEEFLCHIHGLQLQQHNLEGMDLPTTQNVTTKPSGLALIKAMESAMQFEVREGLDRCDSGIADDVETSPLQVDVDVDGNLQVTHQQPYQNSEISDGLNYDYALRDTARNQARVNAPQGEYEYIDVKKVTGDQSSRKPESHYQNTNQNKNYENSSKVTESPAAQNDYIEVISGDFHPPSSIGDDDIQSRQLRQEIIDINKRYEQTKQLSEGIEECTSLGGLSV